MLSKWQMLPEISFPPCALRLIATVSLEGLIQSPVPLYAVSVELSPNEEDQRGDDGNWKKYKKLVWQGWVPLCYMANRRQRNFVTSIHNGP